MLGSYAPLPHGPSASGSAHPLRLNVVHAVLTTGANELVRDIHDRMPVILPPASYDTWLDCGTGPDALLALLRAFPASSMSVRPVSGVVGSSRNEGPGCVEPPGPARAMLF